MGLTGTILAGFAMVGLVIGVGFFCVLRVPQSPVAPAPPAAPEHPLTAQEVAALRAMPTCPFCGGIHHGLCRRVTEIWYHPAGGVKHAILRDEWDMSRTIWLEDLPDEA